MNTLRVLLISDRDPSAIRQSLDRQAGNFVFTVTTHLTRALTALADSRFDAVLMDLALSDANAMESIQRVRTRAQDAPIIVLLDEGDAITVRNSAFLGGQDYTMKGCRCDSLIRAMHHALRHGSDVMESDAPPQEVLENERLVSHLSHECRNALACIHSFGNILKDGLAGEMSAEQREYVGIMLDNASLIRNVLDDLLEGQRKESETMLRRQ